MTENIWFHPLWKVNRNPIDNIRIFILAPLGAIDSIFISFSSFILWSWRNVLPTFPSNKISDLRQIITFLHMILFRYITCPEYNFSFSSSPSHFINDIFIAFRLKNVWFVCDCDIYSFSAQIFRDRFPLTTFHFQFSLWGHNTA